MGRSCADTAELIVAVVGVGALLAGLLPRLVEGRSLSTRIGFLLLGVVVFVLPLDLPVIDPLAHPALTEHLTEVGSSPR